MDIVRSLADPLIEGYAQGVVAIGNFDGVHLGHQSLLMQTYHRAVASSCPAIILTFEPHPREILPRPNFPMGEAAENFRLTNFEQKCAIFRALNFDAIVALEFDRDFAALSPIDFCQKVFADSLQPELVVVGRDFCFGAKRAGSIADLQEMGSKMGFQVLAIDKLMSDNAATIAYSSTQIRKMIAAGEVAKAQSHLGRAWEVMGEVIHGDHRGRTIGFPTANFIPQGVMAPKFGVYAVTIRLPEDNIRGIARPLAGVGAPTNIIYKGVANFGIRPTVDGSMPRMEAHIFDFDRDIYGQIIQVGLVDFIRDEKRFSGLPELVEQIKLDAAIAKNILKDK